MSRIRIIVGVLVMAIAVPGALFQLLHLSRPAEFFTIAIVTFLAWGLSDLLARIVERPRLENRSPGKALREDLDRRTRE